MPPRDPEREPFLRRPLRSLLKLRIGTVLGAYALWVLGGLLISGLCALVIFGSSGSGSDDDGAIRIDRDGDTVTLAQYRTVKPGERKAAVERLLGEPATRENPFRGVTPEELQEDCIGYTRAGREEDTLFFCFTDDALTSKHTL